MNGVFPATPVPAATRNNSWGFHSANVGAAAMTVQWVRSPRTHSDANRSRSAAVAPGSRRFDMPWRPPVSGSRSFHALIRSRRSYQLPPCSKARKRSTKPPPHSSSSGTRRYHQPATSAHDVNRTASSTKTCHQANDTSTPSRVRDRRRDTRRPSACHRRARHGRCLSDPGAWTRDTDPQTAMRGEARQNQCAVGLH